MIQFQHNLLSNFIEVSTLLDLGSELMNHTKTNTYINPVDVATVIDMLAMLVNTQARVINLRTIRWTDTRVSYARAKKDFPRLDETEEFMTVILFPNHTSKVSHAFKVFKVKEWEKDRA